MTECETLLISSGNGPAECRQAVGHLLRWIKDEADILGLELDIAERPAPHGPASAIVILRGLGAGAMAADLAGGVLWRCPSQLRPKYPRKSWFIGVFRLPAVRTAIAIPPDEVELQAIRAGGPGGQHQNKTSSAIRARWAGPDGRVWAVVVRDTRSQHQNRRLALDRLSALVAAEAAESDLAAQGVTHALHDDVRKQSPRRVFEGAGFHEQ